MGNGTINTVGTVEKSVNTVSLPTLKEGMSISDVQNDKKLLSIFIIADENKNGIIEEKELNLLTKMEKLTNEINPEEAKANFEEYLNERKEKNNQFKEGRTSRRIEMGVQTALGGIMGATAGLALGGTLTAAAISCAVVAIPLGIAMLFIDSKDSEKIQKEDENIGLLEKIKNFLF